MDNSEIFNVLRPICVKLTKEMNKTNVQMLREILKRIDNKPVQDMHEYILFPLRLILKTARKNEDLIIEVVECISSLLRKTYIRNLDLFQNLIADIISLISHPNDNGRISSNSEDLKLSAVVCITLLFEKCDKELLKNVYRNEFYPQLGHLIFVLLRLTENESYKNLRIKSVECLLVLSLGKEKKNISLSRQASQMFTSFLPGISVTLSKIITGSVIQGHAVVVAALRAWTEIICLVLGDANLEELEVTESQLPTNSKIPIILKNEKWLESTAAKLNILIEGIAESAYQDHWAVKLAMANWAGMLLLHCTKSLGKSIGPLLDVLVTLSADDRSNVSKASCEYLQKVTNEKTLLSKLLDTVEENIYNLITKLPRIFHTANDSKKLSTLQSLTGYTELLILMENSAHRLLLSPPQMNRLGSGLIQLISLDLSNVRLLTEQNSSNNMNELIPDNFQPIKKTFQHFQDAKIYSAWVRFCRLLGSFGDEFLLLDHCVDLFHTSPQHRIQIVMLIQELVVGSADSKSEMKNKPWTILEEEKTCAFESKDKSISDLNLTVGSLLDMFLDPSIWRLSAPRKTNDFFSGQVSLLLIDKPDDDKRPIFSELNNNVWLTGVILEAIASFSQVLGSHFHTHLIKVFYPLLDKMGSDSAVVAHSAFYAANVISKSVGCNNIAELIESNSDYLVNSISLRLQNVDENPEAPRVLRTIFKNSGPNILPLVDDSVEELFNSLDVFHSNSSELFMEVLYSLVCLLNDWYPTVNANKDPNIQVNFMIIKDDEEEDGNDLSMKSEKVSDFFIKYHRLKQEAEGECGDVAVENDKCEQETMGENEGEDIDVEKKAEQPKHVKLTVRVLQRCIHFLHREELRFCCLILDVIQTSVRILGDWTDDLLPLVHQLWATFKLKFSDGNLIIIRKAYETLLIMGEVCGDFITTRTLTEVLPKLTHWLKERAKKSADRDTEAFKFTGGYKLQLIILETIAKLMKNLRYEEDHVDNLVRACVPYMSKDQPTALQMAALETFHLLATLEPDIVWFHLIGFYNQNVATSSKVMVITENRNETVSDYEENVKIILNKMKNLKLNRL